MLKLRSRLNLLVFGDNGNILFSFLRVKFPRKNISNILFNEDLVDHALKIRNAFTGSYKDLFTSKEGNLWLLTIEII